MGGPRAGTDARSGEGPRVAGICPTPPLAQYLQNLQFSLLIFHKHLHQQSLLLSNMSTDVLGDVWNQPIHQVTHRHHNILKKDDEGQSGRQDSPEFLR